MNKIIFTKHSNERDKRFCIRTEIWQDEKGKRWVEKHPVYPEAESYISEIARHQEVLAKLLCRSKISVNECRRTKTGLRLVYLEGQTMEERLDQCLAAADMEEIVSVMQQYFAEFENIPQVEFLKTPQFARVFGEGYDFQQAAAFAAADIDMIFSNVLIQGNRWHLIDYEWTFDFPVPVKFIIYRSLYYYIRGNAKRLILEQEQLYRKFGISAAEEEQFAGMEAGFQRYILGEHTPIRLLYDDISPGCIYMKPVIEEMFREQNQRMVQVFYDTGNGYLEAGSRKHRAAAGPVRLQLQIPPQAGAIRIDPCSFPCLLALKSLRTDQKDLDFVTNGSCIEKNLFVFETADPQLVISQIPAGADQITIEFQITALTGAAGQVVRSLIKQLQGSKEQIDRMCATKVWRWKEKCWKLLGRR